MAVLSPFDENIGPQFLEQGNWGVVFKHDHEIDTANRRKKFCPLIRRDEWSLAPFQPPDTNIAVDCDNQKVSQFGGLLQQANVTGMEQVETAIREDDRSSTVTDLIDPAENCRS